MVSELIWLVHDALCAAKELDAALSYQLPAFHQLAMDLLFARALCHFHAHDTLVAVQLARLLTFAIAPAIKPSICHAAVPRVAGCNQEPAAKSLPYLQHLGHCLMHHLKAYAR